MEQQAAAANQYAHLTPKVRRNNIILAGMLVGFVGGVYYWTTGKMRSNELTEISAELDEVRRLKAQAADAAAKAANASTSAPAAPAAAAAPKAMK